MELTIKIISTSPSFVPPDEAIDAAIEYIADNLDDEGEVEAVTTDSIEFIDQGGNFERVLCNICGQKIEIDFWQAAMDKAYEKGFTDLTFSTPCCYKKKSLNDLTYESPAGFATFAINIKQSGNILEQIDLKHLEQILGTQLKIIHALY